MAHGIKPYGRTQAQETIFGVQDMGELAARLGSPITFDRRGNVIWYDDFESGTNRFAHVIGGVGDTITWDALSSLSGTFSCRLHARNAVGAAAVIVRYLAYPILSRFGLEFSFATPHSTQNVIAYMYLDDGIRIYTSAVLYDVGAQDLRIFDGIAPWPLVDGNLIIRQSIHGYNTVKLVVDWLTRRYVRLIVNGNFYDISAFAPQDSGPTVVPNLEIAMWGQYNTPGATDTYIDDVIVSQNEP